MITSGLIKMLKSLSPQELKDFRAFITSPFFNKNENTIKFFNHLKKYYPDFNDPELTKENVYKRLFGKGKYNDGFMRTMIFNLTILLEDYFIYINVSKDKVKSGISLLRELNERRIDKVFKKNHDLTEELNESITDKNPEYYLNKYELSILKKANQVGDRLRDKASKEITADHSYDFLSNFYLANLLKEYRYLLYRNEFAPGEIESDYFEYLILYLTKDKNKFSDNKYVDLHLNEIGLLKNGAEEHYFRLKEILKNNRDSISHSERFSLQNLMQMYSIKKAFEGIDKFKNERFELYKIILDQKLYDPLGNDFFEETLFANIVNHGLSLKEYEWVKEFISDFSGMLHEDVKETVENYSYARLSFETGNYETAIEYLNSIPNVKHMLFKFPVRTLTMMTLYEMDLMEQVFYQIDSFRHYYSKNKDQIAEGRASRIGNFLKYFTKLVKLREKPDRTEILDLESELKHNTNVSERNWMLKKLSGLK